MSGEPEKHGAAQGDRGGGDGSSNGRPEAIFERSATFTASHHYRHPAWSDERNRAVFGQLTEPHDHEYRATVWIRGSMAPVTGFATDLPALDAALEELFGPLHGSDINRFVPEFATGELLPSCENLARWAYVELGRRLPHARVIRVRIAESPDLAAEYPAPEVEEVGRDRD